MEKINIKANSVNCINDCSKHGDDENTVKLVRIASLISLIGNAILFIVKIGIGFFVSSLSIIGDGLDSGADVVISIMTILVSFVISRPSDRKFPWGKQRAETIASMALSFLIMFAGIQLFFVSAKKIILFFYEAEEIAIPNFLGFTVILFSVFVKLMLALNQYYIAKKTNSLMLKANAKNMANDVILSVSVLIGLLFSYIFKLVLLDPVIALLVSVWIFKTGVEIFIEVNVELMDGNVSSQLYRKLFSVVNTIEGVHSPHRVRIRKIGTLLDIDLDIEVDANMSVFKSHQVAEKVTTEIKENFENVYDVMIHIEPYGFENNEEEGFGLRYIDVE